MVRQGVIVWLTAIRYSGANIGSNTAFELKAGAEKTSLKTPIRHAAERRFAKLIYIATATGNEADVPITVEVIEGMEPVPDKAHAHRNFVIPRGKGRQSLEPLTVLVQEDRGIFGKGGTASFVFEFEAEFFTCEKTGIRYVAGSDNGWLLIRPEDKRSKEFSLPEYLKVDVTRVTIDRDYFTVMEGPLKGRRGSVSSANGMSRLSSNPTRQVGPIELILHQRSLRLSVPGLGEFGVKRPQQDAFQAGKRWPVEIPDFPHPGGRRYLGKSTFATSWFRIADPDVPARYLHTGTVSLGCCTVKDTERWDEIYRFLINRRLDDRHVGTFLVVDD